MAFIPVPNTVETVLQGDYVNQDVFNVLNWLFADPLSESELLAFAEGVFDSWHDNFRGWQCINYGLPSIKATGLDSAISPSQTFFTTTENTGSRAELGWQLNASLCISLHTALRGRSYRGRDYLGGMYVSALQDAGTVLPAALAAILGGFVDMIDDIEATFDCQLVIVSRQHDHSPRVTGVTTPVNAISANGDLDSQRRRLKGRGT